MAAVPDPPAWLERWTRRRIAARGGAIAVALGAATLLTPPIGDAALIVALGALAIAMGVAWRRRAALEALPLCLGEVAVRQVVSGRPALRVRAWLGAGRVIRELGATASLRMPHGAELPLEVEVPALPACGPVTLTIPLPDLAVGDVSVAIRSAEGARTWTAGGRFPLATAPAGPLDVPVRRAGGRLAWDRAAWDRPMGQAAPRPAIVEP